MKLRISILLLLSLNIFACTSQNKERKFLVKKPTHTSKQGKARGYLHANIKEVYQTDEHLTLQVILSPIKSLTGVELKWQLPEHLKLLAGDRTQQVDLTAGQQHISEISVDKDNIQQGDKIFVFATKVMNGERHGATYSYIYRDKVNQKQGLQLKKADSKKSKKILE